jgi:hypothetical protein
MSASFLLSQVFFMLIALKYGTWKTPAGCIPLNKVIPLFAELPIFFLSAAAKFLEGEY